MTDKKNGNSITHILIKSQLIHAQSLEIMLGDVADISMKSSCMAEFGETLEEIANIYLNIVDSISLGRASRFEKPVSMLESFNIQDCASS